MKTKLFIIALIAVFATSISSCGNRQNTENTINSTEVAAVQVADSVSNCCGEHQENECCGEKAENDSTTCCSEAKDCPNKK